MKIRDEEAVEEEHAHSDDEPDDAASDPESVLGETLRETNIIPSKPLPEAMLQRGCDQHVVLLLGGTALAMLKESLSEGLCRPNSVMRLSEPLDPASSFAVFWPLNSNRIGANYSRRHDAAATNNKPLRIKLPFAG